MNRSFAYKQFWTSQFLKYFKYQQSIAELRELNCWINSYN